MYNKHIKEVSMIKSEIIDVGKLLYNKNLTVGTSGNISVKTQNGIYITGTGTALGFLNEDDIVLIDFDGKESGNKKASSEKMLHVEIYKQRNDINAIIHTHPEYLTSFAVCHKELNEPIMSENILYFEDIPVAPYAMPSSEKLVKNTVSCMLNRDVVMMANHGAVAAADSLKHAFLKMETAEYWAKVTLYTKFLGGAKLLDQNDIKDLINLKQMAK